MRNAFHFATVVSSTLLFVLLTFTKLEAVCTYLIGIYVTASIAATYPESDYRTCKHSKQKDAE